MYVTIGRRREKRWGVLFTCLTIRAIHLELAGSLTTDSAIMAIRRLASRRGQPLAIYSDNGTNFRGANNELRNLVRAMDPERQRDYAINHQMEWHFNPPSAPHMGGAWERMVRSVKTALAVTLQEDAPREETLTTLLAEVEHIVNSRPLTRASTNPDDVEALTPNHFLIGRPSGRNVFERYKVITACPRKQWQIAQRLTDVFWSRWLKEYLPTLLPRTRWSTDTEPVKIDDVVLISDIQAPRNSWLKGVVERTFLGADGRVRVAEVRTANGRLTRPTAKLIQLTEAAGAP